MHPAGRLLPHIFLARFHRSVDLASRRTKATARLGMHVRCTISQEYVLQGDVGSFLEWKDDVQLQCFVQWRGCGRSFWVHFSSIEILPPDPVHMHLLSVQECHNKFKDFPIQKRNYFRDDFQWSVYLKSILSNGVAVKCVQDFELIRKGDFGRFVRLNNNYPPCLVEWKDFGGQYWVPYQSIEIKTVDSFTPMRIPEEGFKNQKRGKSKKKKTGHGRLVVRKT